MARFFRRRRERDISRAELLSGIRSAARNIEVAHTITIRHERIPKPESGMLQFYEVTGAPLSRYPVQIGPLYKSGPFHIPGGAEHIWFEWQ